MKNFLKTLVLLLTLLFTSNLDAQQSWRLLRFPAIYKNQIVFTYAGDLYTVSANGGIARKLTNGKGVEIFARFSHNGKMIAFTGQYDGNTEVYIMPSKGGVPKRITFTATLNRDDVSDRMGPNNIVMGWTNNDKYVLFRSRMHDWDPFKGQLFLAPLSGDIPTQLPLSQGGFASYSPDGTKLAFNKIFRQFRTWKRYRGGMVDDIRIYNFKTKKITDITNNPAQDIIPMWHGNKIYFLSDRDSLKRMNLYVYDLRTKTTKKLTSFKNFDIKFPSIGPNAIVFENGGYIYRFDLKTNKYHIVNIQIDDDFAQGRGGWIDVSKRISNFGISPNGKRALFDARGEVFTVPAKQGITRNLTKTSGVDERNAKWSPNGKYIAFISDKTGEDEVYIIPQNGSAKPTQLTFGKSSYKWDIAWSPDSKKILWTDRALNIKYVNINNKKVTEVVNIKRGRRPTAVWSPDSKWIAYPKQDASGISKIYLYSLNKKENYSVTTGWYSSSQPLFSSDGKYLFFVSSRVFHPIYSWVEWNYAYQDMQKIYFVTLSKSTPSPFKPKDDEAVIVKNKKKKASKKKETVKLNVDLSGINNRIIALPIEASAYFGLSSVGNKIFYIRHGSKDSKSLLLMYDLKTKKENKLGNIKGYIISANHKKMLVAKDKNYYIINLPAKKLILKNKLVLSGLKMNLNRKAEWNQIFNQAWRQVRDFFFVSNMKGLNWTAIKKKYEPLVKYVNNRIDLTYIMGEMIGELGIGHAYVGGGDYPKAKRIKTGLLGAKLVRDNITKNYKIVKILNGENWSKTYRSPLRAIGVNLKAGDYILSVDGQPVSQMQNIYESLIGKANKEVSLTVSPTNSFKNSRKVIVVPTADEQQLYYYNWVENNIKKVSEATHGQVGYIHIPDMETDGLNDFVKLFYPQLRKKALIIDIRSNGGGNVSPMIIERLRRKIAMMDNMRDNPPSPDPFSELIGPKVLIIDQFTASDGDIFTYRFKKYKLGEVIGKRTWGGVTGISSSVPYVDGGYLYVPEYGIFGIHGKKWIVEGHGVDPNIVVDNNPAKEYQGIDQQLNMAIKVIMKELKNYKYKIPTKTPPPPID